MVQSTIDTEQLHDQAKIKIQHDYDTKINTFHISQKLKKYTNSYFLSIIMKMLYVKYQYQNISMVSYHNTNN